MSNFGASTPNKAFCFGAASPTTNTGLAATAATTTPQTGAFSFGTLPATAAATTLPATQAVALSAANTGFGLTPANPTTGALTTAAATTNPPGGFSFGTQAPIGVAATSFSFGTTTSQSGGLSMPTVTSTVQPSFGKPTLPPSFGAQPAATTTITSGFTSFGTTTLASGGGAFDAKATATTSVLGSSLGGGGIFGQTATPSTTTVTPPSLGLGGVDINAMQPKTTEGKTDNTKVKETQLPEQIIKKMENLKCHIKDQKQISSDIARTSTRKLFNVSTEIQNLNWSLQEIANCIENNYGQIKTLRSETSQAIQHAEMAQRTQETPVGLQFENTAPFQYFIELVQKYESELIIFRNQVELTEKHMRSIANPQSFTPEDIKKGLQQMHESFIALAGRLHEIHQKVEEQKDQYLNLRKYFLRDKTNVFEDVNDDQTRANVPKISGGPTPFSTVIGMNLGLPAGAAIQNQALNPWQGNANQQNSSGMKQTAFSMGMSSGTSLLSGTGFGISTNLSLQNENFNLQKPPIGAKRNKQ